MAMQFKISLTESQLADYVIFQLNTFFPDANKVQHIEIEPYITEALDRIYLNFSKIKTKYYREEDTVLFSHLNGDQYCVFLYYLSNTLYRQGASESVCTKIFLLNKYLHGIDAFYSVKLPEHFMVVHPLGTVLGNAVYGDYFVVYQNCTVGASAEGIYPCFGKGTIMYSASAVIGKLSVGNQVVLARSATVVNTDIPDRTIVFGMVPGLVLKENKKTILNQIFEL